MMFAQDDDSVVIMTHHTVPTFEPTMNVTATPSDGNQHSNITFLPPWDFDDTALHVLNISAAAIMVIPAVIGNLLVVIAVLTSSTLRTASNSFIVNLAVCDMAVGLLAAPTYTIHRIVYPWPFGKLICDICTNVDILSCTTSVLSLIAIAADRFCAVRYPMRRRTRKTALIWNIVIWISSILITVGLAVFYPSDPADDVDPNLCLFAIDRHVPILPKTLVAAFAFYVPFLLVIIFYSKVLHEMSTRSAFWKNSKTSNGRSGSSSSHRYVSGNNKNQLKQRGRLTTPQYGVIRAVAEQEKQVAKTMAIVIGCFVVCWLPYSILWPMSDYLSVFSNDLITWLAYENSALNPIIYAGSDKRFRYAFQRVLMRKKLKTEWERRYSSYRQSLKRTTLSTDGTESYR